MFGQEREMLGLGFVVKGERLPFVGWERGEG